GCADAARELREVEAESVTLGDFTDLVAGPEPEVVEVEDTSEGPTDSEEPDEKKTAPMPLWQRFQRNLNEPIVTTARPASTRTVPLPAEAEPTAKEEPEVTHLDDDDDRDSEESQRPLWQKYRSTKTPATGQSQASEIEVFILGHDGALIRDAFVDELFDGDQESYLEVLDQLKESHNWPEASRVIAERVFKRFQVNIYSEEAVAFTNAVEARFRVQNAGD
ncbi:MAG: hypothetical protein R3178_08335, partial [Rhodothermales bacterium]|nr:hypothetical protein [Rhodothermales bacterium]